ncbi:GNAT family N-acetyltransferase [Bifidobacterium sp. W8115]|uniref:GNAT family N-acetyltransferase n=2 Tax=Bifidobacterium TaxID=1678 RepID=A0A556R6B4_9BIFI|nr:GNAT family N-acetyltransferase [Bifidobacterium sp. W8112]MBI0124408.1 GNAT family N-acetyltransferase [Bifidobacterium apousia]MBI0137247.1 GNAT family N-acetyltransferase [Bifidobacterium sp. W8120]TSJ84421.1 GNAT family N-acetyltransferase [Bifidobacterium apousia]
MSMSGRDNNRPQTQAERPDDVASRQLPDRIEIPYIRGEMLHLRPAVIADLTAMDQLEAFYNSTGITGKGPSAERAVVNAWVRRSVAWSKGLAARDSGVGDPESRRTLAWAMVTDADTDQDGSPDADATKGVIGMIFLIDVDGWSRSARIQVVLGRHFRGRGYSRDAMPRIMTYGYAAAPTGLGLHRIWVAVPEKNTRSISVYQSLGFMISGTSRDALWDAENGKYQDQIVMDALVDEYDPIRSLNAFGMHVIRENPGVAEALVAHGYAADEDGGISGSEESTPSAQDPHVSGDRTHLASKGDPHSEQSAQGHAGPDSRNDGKAVPGQKDAEDTGEGSGSEESVAEQSDEEHTASDWAYGSAEAKRSKRAWWRTLGHGRDRANGGSR